MLLEKLNHMNIKKAAHEAGLVLSDEQILAISEAEIECLAESGLVLFGISAAARLVREFASSPYLVSEHAAKTFIELTESFYTLRENAPASTTDIDILEALKNIFDTEAAGDVRLAESLAADMLRASEVSAVYEIVDNKGNVYRWNPEEWYDNITADGWHGEKWEDTDE